MDLATLIGLLGVVGVLVGAIFTGDGPPSQFINIPSLLIVFGGTVMATLIKFPLGAVFGGFKVGLQTLLAKFEKPEAPITESVELADVPVKKAYWRWMDGK